MKNKLFGKNIAPGCSYCANSHFDKGMVACKKARRIINGKCKAFEYDPLMRIPRSVTLRSTYTADDFKL